MVKLFRSIAITAMLGTSAMAASQSDVQEYARLSTTFDTRQGKPELAQELQLELASCVLNAFEQQRGAGELPNLMALMRTVAEGVQFDDPIVIKFTATHGDIYDAIVRECRSSINNG